MSFVRSLARVRQKQTGARPDWLILGLGNPGAQYSKTRHNVGFMCLNRLAHRSGTRFKSSAKDRADIAEASVAGVSVLLAQPQTYMNDSGIAASRLLRRLNLKPDQCLVIYDDVDIPFGAVRIRQEGTAGGQKGMRSVIEHLQTTEVPRIRVGIGRGPAGTKEYVLTEFGPEERQQLTTLCDHVAEIVETVVREGLVTAMNRFNGQAAKEPQSG